MRRPFFAALFAICLVRGAFAAGATDCDQALVHASVTTNSLNELAILNSATHPVSFDPSKNIQMINLSMQYRTFSQLLVDDDGDFYVFRKLAGPYDPAKRGTYSNLEGHFSYSMNPYITVLWDGGGSSSVHFDPAKSHIVVSRLKLVPGKKEFFYPTFQRNAADAFGTSAQSGQRYRYLTADSPLGDDAFYDELDVPFADENVIVDLPESVYRSVLLDVSKAANLQSGGTPFKLVDFVKKLLQAAR